MRLDAAHSFDLPGGMVDAEFDSASGRQVEAELKREGASPEDEGKTEEDEMKAEYRGHRGTARASWSRAGARSASRTRSPSARTK